MFTNTSSQHTNKASVYGSLENDTSISSNRWDFDSFRNDYSGYADADGGIDNDYLDFRRQSYFDSDAGYGETSHGREEGSFGLNSGPGNRLAISQHPTEEENLIPETSDRRVNGIASTPLVTWNIINMLLSTSLLAFPFLIQHTGYLVFLVVLVVAIMTNYTSRILIDLMYEKSTIYHGKKVRVRLNYIELGRDVFNSNKGATFVQIIQVIEMLAICILNICVLGELGYAISARHYTKQVCTVLAACFALPTFFIRKLIIIGWMQTIGVMSLAVGLIIVQCFCFAYVKSWDPSNIPTYNFTHIPIAIGIAIYAFGIQGIMPGLEEQMKTPKRFGFVVNLTFGIAFFVQCLFSITNAMFYGDKTNQVVIMDLENHFALGITTACLFGISILSHFSLPTLVVMEKLDNAILRTSSCCSSNQERFHTFLQVCLRIGVMTFSVGIAMLVPYFAYLMAFVGSAITVFPSLLLPSAFHLKLRYRVLAKWQIVVDVFIVLFSVVCIGAGCFYSFQTIYYAVHGSKHYLFI